MIANIIRIFILPLVVILGSIFNLLTIFVMKTNTTSIRFYLSALAIADTVVLLVGGTNLWLENAFQWSFLTISGVTCKIFAFIFYTMLHYSVSIIIIITGEKLYVVAYPLKANEIKFNKKRSVLIVIIVLLVTCIINSHLLITHSIIEYKVNNSTNNISICMHDKWNVFYEDYWSYIDGFFYTFLPFILISIFNGSIIFCLKKKKEESLDLQHVSCSKMKMLRHKSMVGEKEAHFRMKKLKARYDSMKFKESPTLKENFKTIKETFLVKSISLGSISEKNYKLCKKTKKSSSLDNSNHYDIMKRRSAIIHYDSRNISVTKSLAQKHSKSNFTNY